MANFKLMDQNGNNAGEVTLNDNVFSVCIDFIYRRFLQRFERLQHRFLCSSVHSARNYRCDMRVNT